VDKQILSLFLTILSQSLSESPKTNSYQRLFPRVRQPIQACVPGLKKKTGIEYASKVRFNKPLYDFFQRLLAKDKLKKSCRPPS
jgi:hypothetical protein